MIRYLILFFTCCTVTSFGQQESPAEMPPIPRAVLKLSPLQFFSNTFEMSIEALNPSYSRSVDLALGFRSGAGEYQDGKGASFEAGYRRYVSPMKLHTRKTREFYQGIYYSVFVRGSYFKGTDWWGYYDPNVPDGVEERIYSAGPGFMLGLQKSLWQIIYLDVFVGGGITFSDITRSQSVSSWERTMFEPGYEGIYPKLGVKIGVGL